MDVRFCDVNVLVPEKERKRSAAFTGYRSYKLPFGKNLDAPAAIALRNALYKEYERLIQMGFDCFLTGGAEGSDLMAAEVILELKKKYRGKAQVSHCLCLPCLNHDIKWRQEDKERLERIKKGSHVEYVFKRPYFQGCMQLRNEYMVDTSAVLISVFDGQPGGTKNTVEYARKTFRKIINFFPTDPVMRVEEFVKPEDEYFYNLKLEDEEEHDGEYKIKPWHKK